MTAIRMRVRDTETGRVLVEQECTDLDLVTAQASYAAEIALAHMASGRATVLEVLDPDGEIGPAGQWIEIHNPQAKEH